MATSIAGAACGDLMSFRNTPLEGWPLEAPRGGALAGCGSLDGEPGHQFLGGALDESGTVAKLLELPPEHVAQLGLLVQAELVLLAIADGACREPFEDHFELMHRSGIRSSFRRGRKTAPHVGGEAACEFLELLRVKQLEHGHGDGHS